MSDNQNTDRRDNLALVRTELANERTLLAYGRTALMVIATGVTVIKFFPESPLLQCLGWTLAVLGVTIGLVGVMRFTRLQRSLHE